MLALLPSLSPTLRYRLKGLPMTRILVLFFILSPLLAQTDSGALAAHSPQLKAGPMIGYATMREVCLWFQGLSEGTLTLQFKAQGSSGPLSEMRATMRSEHRHIVKLVPTNLEPDTRYEYGVSVDGVALNFPYPLTFQTTQNWQYRSEPKDFTIATGSCLYLNDPPDDRPGAAYGGDPNILEKIAGKQPDLMLWLGDNIYYREADFFSGERLAYRNEHTRSHASLQRLLASCSQYAIWDDHDFGPNNSHRAYPMKEISLALFELFWANPPMPRSEHRGIYFSFTWNDVDFFMLDNRFHRAPNELPGSNKDFLGPKQMEWLLDSLAASTATFKIIAMGNQAINHFDPVEGFHHYGREQRQLLDFLSDNRIEGVLFLTGDRHFSELIRLDRPDHYPLFEFTCSPLSSSTYSSMTTEKENPMRVPGTLVHTERNFGLITITGPRKQRQLTLSCYDSSGKLLWQHVLDRGQLRYAKK
jgi:alkaline phosphatase D